jgi:hypothetical protein
VVFPPYRIPGADTILRVLGRIDHRKQVQTAEKSNEITTMPALLEALDISGCIVTIDAAD